MLQWKQEQTFLGTYCVLRAFISSPSQPRAGGSCYHLAISRAAAQEDMEPGQAHNW